MADVFADEMVADAWARIEAQLGRALLAALPLLAPPAEEHVIDAVEAALGVALPADFRASLRIHNGTTWGLPSPVPLDNLYDTTEIIEATQMWHSMIDRDPIFDDPRVWAYQVDQNMISVHGPVRPTLGPAGRVCVGTMNGDVHWFLDLDPPQGGTPGQVVRIDPECTEWDVLTPSWTLLLLRYAEDLELFAASPDSSPLEISELAGPACEWGTTSGPGGARPAWLQDVQSLNPYTW
jgi:cell wall assembly regulator SMI1